MLKRMSLLIVLLVFMGTYAQEQIDIENEITRTKREMKRLKKEREKVRRLTVQDKEEFLDYESRTKQRFSALESETRSTKKETIVHQKKSDSLGAVLTGIKASQKEYDVKQRVAKTRLIAFCEKAMKSTKQIPPSLSKKAYDALNFLKSELATGSIENSEGIHRLIQVLNDTELQLMEIQISQGISPVPEISGSIYRLRIGGVFEAIVDAKGSKSAVWATGSDGEWLPVKDAAVSAEILRAIHIREGKTLPDLVKLPFAAGEKEGGTENE